MKRVSTLTLSILGASILAIALALGAIFPQAVAAQDATATMDMGNMPAMTEVAEIGCPQSTFALIVVAQNSFGFQAPFDISGFNMGQFGDSIRNNMAEMTPVATMEMTPDMTAIATEPAMMLSVDQCAQLLTSVTTFLNDRGNATPEANATAEATPSLSMMGAAFIAHMSGPEEIPGPGDPDATGTAFVVVRSDVNQICWTINVAGINLPASAAHIHKGAVGESGSVVVPLTPPDAGGASNGCANVDPAIVSAILANPSGYYVNVHNADFPDGGLRGNLLGM